jgi:hypothetical protein
MTLLMTYILTGGDLHIIIPPKLTRLNKEGLLESGADECYALRIAGRPCKFQITAELAK